MVFYYVATMKTLRLILGDQLSHDISSLKDCNKTEDIILMCEVWNEATYVKHHKKKIAFLFSAMRHFAKELKESGYKILYTKLEDEQNIGFFKSEIARALKQQKVEHIVVTHPGEYRVLEDIKGWATNFKISVEIRTDDRFLCSPEEFALWAKGRKQLRMEYFYREIRKKYNVLMNDNEPMGGDWNYDSKNRKPPKYDLCIPEPYCNEIDDITREVMSLVSEHFPDHFGDLEPFYFAVTRQQALQTLNLFIELK